MQLRNPSVLNNKQGIEDNLYGYLHTPVIEQETEN